MMTEYEIITSIYTKALKYTDDQEIIKRVRFNERVQCYIYEYKPLTIYKTSIKYCIKKISKIIGGLRVIT
jgi:hypothetical protein